MLGINEKLKRFYRSISSLQSPCVRYVNDAQTVDIVKALSCKVTDPLQSVKMIGKPSQLRENKSTQQ